MDTYKEKYNEALERAKSFKTPELRDVAEYIFPELKKSEDEKIRKELITHCRNTRCVTEEGAERIAKWIDWLEKQGEQKPRYGIGDVLCDKSCTTLNKDIQPNFEITDIRNGMYICDKCSFPISQQDEYELVAKRIEQKPTFEMKTPEESLGIDSEAYNKIVDECIYGEQKPAWSEEDDDDAWMNDIISKVENNLQLNKAEIDWLKSLRPQSH